MIVFPLIIFSHLSCSNPFDDWFNMSSSKEMIQSLTKGVRNARVTVGIVQNGEMSFTVYGENAKVLPNREYIYDIGSISKAITGHLFARAIHENLITLADLDTSIDRFLDLPHKNYYPTIRRLLTHTSGYKYQYAYFTPPKPDPFANPFYGVTRGMTLHHVRTINLENKDYKFDYSNFGLAVAGMALENIFDKDYTSLVNGYFRNLGLNSTRVGNGTGNLSFHYRWNNDNPYIAAGGIVSTVGDLMKFAQMQMDNTIPYAEYAYRTWAENLDTVFDFPEIGNHTDAMGLGWHIDTSSNIIWHGGALDTFCTYMGFNVNEGIAVVVLSNIRSRIPTWIIGSQIFKELR